MNSADSERPSLRDRATFVTFAILLVVTIGAWWHVVSALGASDGMDMDTMAPPPTLAAAAAFVASWGIMMAAMMLPSALPMIALYGAIQRTNVHADAKGAPVLLFTTVYAAVWTATSVPVYGVSVFLDRLAPDVLPYGVGAMLIVAGVYQLSPLKQACLRACRTPLGFLLGRWRAGYGGSLALGWAHAAYCLGCCWALMIVLVVAGRWDSRGCSRSRRSWQPRNCCPAARGSRASPAPHSCCWARSSSRFQISWQRFAAPTECNVTHGR